MNNKAVLQYEWSLVLWTYEFQGAKYTISVKTELRFFGRLEANIRSLRSHLALLEHSLGEFENYKSVLFC